MKRAKNPRWYRSIPVILSVHPCSAKGYGPASMMNGMRGVQVPGQLVLKLTLIAGEVTRAKWLRRSVSLVRKFPFSVEQIVAVLKQAELGLPVADLIRQVGISEQACGTTTRTCTGTRPSQRQPDDRSLVEGVQ